MPESFTCHQCHRPQRIGRRHWTKYQPVYSEGATEGGQAVGNCVCLHVNNYWRLWLLMLRFWCVSEGVCLSAHRQWQRYSSPGHTVRHVCVTFIQVFKNKPCAACLKAKTTATEQFPRVRLGLHTVNNRVQTWCLSLWLSVCYTTIRDLLYHIKMFLMQ